MYLHCFGFLIGLRQVIGRLLSLREIPPSRHHEICGEPSVAERVLVPRAGRMSRFRIISSGAIQFACCHLSSQKRRCQSRDVMIKDVTLLYFWRKYGAFTFSSPRRVT